MNRNDNLRAFTSKWQKTALSSSQFRQNLTLYIPIDSWLHKTDNRYALFSLFDWSTSFSDGLISYCFLKLSNLKNPVDLPDFFIDPAGTGHLANWRSGTGLSGLPDIRYTPTWQQALLNFMCGDIKCRTGRLKTAWIDNIKQWTEGGFVSARKRAQ